MPAHIQLTTLKPGSKTVAINDTRSAADRVYRETGTVSPTKYFADDTLQPSPLALVASRLADSLPEHHLADSIELTCLNVGYSVYTKQYSSAGQPYIPPNIPPGVAAIGLLLGYGIVAAAQRAAADESAFVSITLRVGDKELSTNKFVSIDRNRAAVVAVEEALSGALDDLGAQARDLDAPAKESEPPKEPDPPQPAAAAN